MKAPVKLKQGRRVRWQHPDREWLHHHYVVLDKTCREIAAEVDTTYATIAAWCREYGFTRSREELSERHSRYMTGEGNPAYVDGTSWRYQRNVLLKRSKPRRCLWCGAMKRLQVHHVDHDRSNGDLDNLEWLCGPCNRMEAQIHALESAGRATVERRDNKMILTFTEG